MKGKWMLRKISKVEPQMPYIICTYSTGEVIEYDLSEVLKSNGSIALPLREPTFFNKVFLEMGVPTWPNGMDVCADEVYKKGKQRAKTKVS